MNNAIVRNFAVPQYIHISLITNWFKSRFLSQKLKCSECDANHVDYHVAHVVLAKDSYTLKETIDVDEAQYKACVTTSRHTFLEFSTKIGLLLW